MAESKKLIWTRPHKLKAYECGFYRDKIKWDLISRRIDALKSPLKFSDWR